MSIKMLWWSAFFIVFEELEGHIRQRASPMTGSSSQVISVRRQVKIVQDTADDSQAILAPHDVPHADVPVKDPWMVIYPFVNYDI